MCIVIISASRRTDIPAFYSQWFMNRIRAGCCLTANPYQPSRLERVSLLPEEVEVIVFWSKNPAPLLPHLAELEQLGYRTYFLFTLHDYPPGLEPGVPELHTRLRTFRTLSEAIGPQRVAWRYDPIILSDRTDAAFHRAAFERLSRALEGATERVIISVIDIYRKTEYRLKRLESRHGYSFVRRPLLHPELPGLLADMKALAAAAGMSIQSCCEEDVVLQAAGIPRGACIDGRLLAGLWSLPVTGKDPYQRAGCGCAKAKDIGVFHTCLHGCAYCYATAGEDAARRRYLDHDPAAPILYMPRSQGSGS